MVDSDPRPLPIEEQIKQDPRFSYILEVNPGFVDQLVLLFTAQEQDPNSKHSEFWTNYLDVYDAYMLAIRQVLSDPVEELSEEEWETHKESIREFLDEDIIEAISVSEVPGFFDEKDAINAENDIIVQPSGYFEHFKQVKRDYILNYPVAPLGYDFLITEAPEELIRLSQANKQTQEAS